LSGDVTRCFRLHAIKLFTKDLGMRKICTKMVPRLLNDGQKERRVQVCEDILEKL